MRRLGGGPATELSLASRTGWLDLRPADRGTSPWSGRERPGRACSVSSSPPARRWDESRLGSRARRDPRRDAHRRRPRPPGRGRRCGRLRRQRRTRLLRHRGGAVANRPPRLPDTAIATLDRGRDHHRLACGSGPVVRPRRDPGRPRPAAGHGPPRRDRDGFADLDRAALAATPGAATVLVADDGQTADVRGVHRPGDVWRAATELVTDQAARAERRDQ